MKVCPNCFNNKEEELKGFISSYKKNGKCEACNSKNVPLINIEELLDFFNELMGNFENKTSGKELFQILQEDFHFFTTKEVGIKILDDVLPNLKTDISDSKSKVDYIGEIKENYSYWEKLKDELKWEKRFFYNIEILEDLGWDGYFNQQYELKTDTILYRARVHHKSGTKAYNCDEMKSSVREKAGGGRANPLGIPYLYLSDNDKTVLYEVRALFLDELSIGSFVLKDGLNVKIVDFTEDSHLYQGDGKIDRIIKSILLKKEISKDLSQPMRRYDSEIEYIPTQFICEYIKFITDAKGIRFQSSLHQEGKNIVIFNQEIMDCIDVELKKITSLNLEAEEI